MDFTQQFATRLLEAREAARMTQSDLAQACPGGLSNQSISQYEKGRQKPTLPVAAELARALGVSLDYLCGLTDSPNNQNPNTPETDLETIADVVGYLSSLSTVFHCSCGTKEMMLSEWECDDPNDCTYTATALYIAHPALAGFVQGWSQMYQLYCNGVLSRDLFETWYAGEISRLSKIPLQQLPPSAPLFGFEPYGDEKR